MERAWIIAVGTELMLGQTVDTNTAWLAERLAGLGVRAVRHLTVPDELAPLADVLRKAAAAADLVVLTGGLGPTEDDLTRFALARALDVELKTDAESLEQIRAFFARRGREMPEHNVIQAQIPEGGQAIRNAWGTAPGIRVAINGTPCYALPGVPHEMQAMFERHVRPVVQEAARGRVLRTRRLHCTGVSESQVGEALAPLMRRGRNPDVGTTAEIGVITVRINALADSPETADQRLDSAEQQVRERLGDSVFGRDDQTLASVVLERLIDRKATLSTAESCTGGMIGTLLTDVPGSSRAYLGGAVSYSNDLKQSLLGVPKEMLAREGAVSEAVARTMAEGARGRFKSDYALSVTGIAGPGGGSPAKPVGLVHVGLAGPEGPAVRTCRFGSDAPRQAIRMRAARAALNLLRLALVRRRGRAARAQCLRTAGTANLPIKVSNGRYV
jgi:nicotinamide-nucleotide amidase